MALCLILLDQCHTSAKKPHTEKKYKRKRDSNYGKYIIFYLVCCKVCNDLKPSCQMSKL